MNILITNDDGIDAKGIRNCIDIMKQYGNIYVVAPQKPQSAVSHIQSIRIYILANI